MASVTYHQAWSENIRWKISRHKVFRNYNSMLIWVVWWSLIHSIPYPMGSKLSICPVYPDCTHYPPISRLVAVLIVRQTITAWEYLCPDNPTLNNNLEDNIRDAGGSDTPGESMKHFLYVKKWKFLKRNWKHYTEAVEICSKNVSSTHEIEKKNKWRCLCVLCHLRSQKLQPTVPAKDLVSMGNTQRLDMCIKGKSVYMRVGHCLRL